MAIASLNNIEKHFGQRALFDHLNFAVDRGERVGLVGDNGTGKSTLFKILLGEMTADVGTASISKNIKAAMLQQDPVFDQQNTVLDEAELAFAELHDLSHRMRDLEHEMADQTGDALEKTLDRYQTVQHAFDLAGGYAWQHKLHATLLGIGLERTIWEQSVSTLSGGQRSRLALAKLLIAQPDLLLLDEPTNHLDLAAIEWLERYLADFSGAAVVISHDRYLLDRLATRIVWLTRSQLNNYPGNYSAFVVQRDLQQLSQQRAYEQQKGDIDKQQEYIRRFGAGQRARQAKGREKRLTRLLDSDAILDPVLKQKNIHLSLDTERRAGDQVLAVKELTKAYGPRLLWKDIAFTVKRGERVGIIGPNGAGKTTLLEALLGQREVDAGDIRWGANLHVGYYDQSLDEFDLENTVMEEIRANIEGGPPVSDQEVRSTLGMLLFRGDDVHKSMSVLSGGERARVALAQLLLERPNVLLLDEPTNHLDIASREALEVALSGFPGTILCVSHDRYFLDKTVRRMLVLQPPGLIDFEGNYSGYAAKLRTEKNAQREQQKSNDRKPAPAKAKRPPTPPPANRPAGGNVYQRPFGRLSTKDLEKQIAQAEAEVQATQREFARGEVFRDPKRGKKAQADYEALTEKLEQLEAEYFERKE